MNKGKPQPHPVFVMFTVHAIERAVIRQIGDLQQPIGAVEATV